MAGDFGVTGDGPASHPVPAPYLTAFHQVREVSPGYFTLETLVGLHPDFLFAGWNYGLQAGTSLTPAGLARFGIKTLVLSRSCAPTWQQKEKFLRSDSVTRQLPAVRSGRILPLSYDELTPSPRNAQAVAAIARWLHPKVFGKSG